MLKIGVLGAGHLGKIHLKLLKEIPGFELVGFFDPNDNNAAQAETTLGVARFSGVDKLIDSVDVVDIVTPTLSHYDCAMKAIKKTKHVFIEKPVTNTLEEAESLVSLVAEADVKAQVGHVERFNPAFLAVKDKELAPMFIETHRLAQFNPRGTDVSVILDLMIHDIDIILSIVKANVKKISASGVPIISKSPDIANARIEFDNGCVANVTASRISIKNLRKMRIFQHDAYISVNFLKKTTEIIRLSENDMSGNPKAFEIPTGDENNRKFIHFETSDIKEVNSIKLELELFHEAIATNTEPPVTVLDGYQAMKVAYRILHKINKNGIG